MDFGMSLLIKGVGVKTYSVTTNHSYETSASEILSEIQSRKRTVKFGDDKIRRKYIIGVYFNVDTEDE